MRAIMAREPGGPEVLQMGQVEDLRPGPGEILIDVVGAGVNRADLLQRQGHYPPPPGASTIIGLEVSGRIAELGEGVTGWDIGDACVALLAGGGYADQVVAPAGQVVLPPPAVDLLAAAGVIEVAATVFSNLQLARLSEAEVFLVHGGAGGIGSFAIQYAKALGATVITTAGSEEKLSYCRRLGADHAISYRDDWVTAVQTLTVDHGVDVILDNMGAKYLDDHVTLMATHGRLVVIGMQGGSKGQLDLSRLMAKRAWVTSTSLRSRPVDEKAEICRGVVNSVWPLLAAGTIQPTQHQVFALEQAAQAHAQMRVRRPLRQDHPAGVCRRPGGATPTGPRCSRHLVRSAGYVGPMGIVDRIKHAVTDSDSDSAASGPAAASGASVVESDTSVPSTAEPSDGEASHGPSGLDNAETAAGGADAVPDTPDGVPENYT